VPPPTDIGVSAKVTAPEPRTQAFTKAEFERQREPSVAKTLGTTIGGIIQQTREAVERLTQGQEDRKQWWEFWK